MARCNPYSHVCLIALAFRQPPRGLVVEYTPAPRPILWLSPCNAGPMGPPQAAVGRCGSGWHWPSDGPPRAGIGALCPATGLLRCFLLPGALQFSGAVPQKGTQPPSFSEIRHRDCVERPSTYIGAHHDCVCPAVHSSRSGKPQTHASSHLGHSVPGSIL